MTKTVEGINLIKGLDLNSPRLATEPGALALCKNYEIDADGGYSLVSGGSWVNGIDGATKNTDAAFYGTKDALLASPYTRQAFFAFCAVTGTDRNLDEWTTAAIGLGSGNLKLFAVDDGGETARLSFYEDDATTRYTWVAGLFENGPGPDRVSTAASNANVSIQPVLVGKQVQAVWKGIEVERVSRGEVPAVVAQFVANLVVDYYNDRNASQASSANANNTYCSAAFFLNNKLYAVNGTTGVAFSQIQGYSINTEAVWNDANLGFEVAFNRAELEPKEIISSSWIGSGATSVDDLQVAGAGVTDLAGKLPGGLLYWEDATSDTYVMQVEDYYRDPITTFVGNSIYQVRAATTANVNLANEVENGDTIDGVVLATNDLILVKDQDAEEDNGIYSVSATGAPIRALIIDDDTLNTEERYTAEILEGTVNSDKFFRMEPAISGTLGTTAMNWFETFPAQGVLNVSDVYEPSGGSKNSVASSALPLSTTGSFGKWVEATVVISETIQELNFPEYEEFYVAATSGGIRLAYGIILKVSDNIFYCTRLQDVSGVDLPNGDWSDYVGNNIYRASDGDELANNILAGSSNEDSRQVLHTTTSNIPVTLPSFLDISDYLATDPAPSRYVTVEHNFFASTNGLAAGRNAVYMANGVGHALQFDGESVVRIRTGLPTSQDKPTFVSVHNNRLCLGYEDGTVVLSVSGEPTNFSGVEGALVFGIGEPVHGLCKLAGSSTAVFGTNSIHILHGTDESDISLSHFSDNSGCLKYTAVSMGPVMYTNRHGIYQLNSSDVFGDFKAVPVSAPVRPWLNSRLTGLYGRQKGFGQGGFGQPVSSRPLYAFSIPSRNQYRLMFGDGTMLTTTVVDYLGGSPKFTTQEVELEALPFFDTYIYFVTAVGQNEFNEDCVMHCTSSQDTGNHSGMRRMEFIRPKKDQLDAYVVIGPLYLGNILQEQQIDTLQLLLEGSYGNAGVAVRDEASYEFYADQFTFSESLDHFVPDTEVILGAKTNPIGDGKYVSTPIHITSRQNALYLLFGVNPSLDDNTSVHLPHRLQNIIFNADKRRVNVN